MSWLFPGGGFGGLNSLITPLSGPSPVPKNPPSRMIPFLREKIRQDDKAGEKQAGNSFSAGKRKN
jgi:hypothetical protein